jgi:aldose 1-epimerase
MELITLGDGGSELVLAPAIGGAILSWTWQGVPVLRPPLPGGLELGSVRSLGAYPLVPFSNRIKHGAFEFDGARYELPAISGGHAIHGVGWKRGWTCISASPREAVLTLQHEPDELWPFSFHAAQHFALSDGSLSWGIRLTNTHGAQAPAGLGFHPYLPRLDGATLTFHASGVWFNGPDVIPLRHARVPGEWDHGAGLHVGSTIVDNCFTGWRAPAVVDYAAHRLTMTADKLFRFFIAFTPEDKDFFAIEPVSHMNDGLNHRSGDIDHGVVVLRHGETLSGEMRMEVSVR